MNLQRVYALEIKVNDFVVDANKGLVWGEMVIRFSTKNKIRKKLTEAFKQQWKNRKIIQQQFFYHHFEDEH